jgi:hypothetical protein
MDDLLERALAARLQEIADTVPDELAPPADLELRVARQRKRKRSSSGTAFFLAVAAILLFAVATAAVVRSTSPVPTPATRVPLVDPLPRGTRLLAASGRYVVALDRNGHQLATMVTARRGPVVDVQITRDHRSLWYLSVRGTVGVDCGEVVRADLVDRSSQVIAHAVSFGISPDARRLVVSGYGNVAAGGCQRGLAPGAAIIDLWKGTRTHIATPAVARAAGFTPDGTGALLQTCTASVCELRRHGASGYLDVRSFAAGGGEVFVVTAPGDAVVALDPSTLAVRNTVAVVGAPIDRVVAAQSGLYIVQGTHLFRYRNGALTPLPVTVHGPVVAVPPWTVTAP